MTTAERITADRLSRGLGVPNARRILITLAIKAGYDIPQIGAMLRSERKPAADVKP